MAVCERGTFEHGLEHDLLHNLLLADPVLLGLPASAPHRRCARLCMGTARVGGGSGRVGVGRHQTAKRVPAPQSAVDQRRVDICWAHRVDGDVHIASFHSNDLGEAWLCQQPGRIGHGSAVHWQCRARQGRAGQGRAGQSIPMRP